MSQRLPVRIVKKDERALQNCDTLPPELAEAIRDFMRSEWQRLRRDELFYLRRGMMSELDGINEELNLK